MASIPIDEYKDAMRGAVCGVCMYFAEDKGNSGRCAHEGSGQCSLFEHLPEVVDAISNIDTGSIQPYLEALRAKVCAHCEHQDARSVCDQRDSPAPIPTWCVLDSYFNLVVGAVEDVQKQHGPTTF